MERMKVQIIPKATKEAMKAYKAEGHTNREVADKFNTNYETTKVVCRGIAHQRQRVKQSGIESFTKRFNRKFGKSVEIVGEYKGIDKRITVKCITCGHVWEWPCGNLRKGLSCDCPKCKEIERQEKLAIEIEAKQKRQKQRLEENKRKKLAKEKERKEREQAKWHDCPVCGKRTNRKVYCSDVCARKHYDAIKDVRRRERIEQQLVDKDISLDKLIERDNNICWLCGLVCDKTDYTYKGNAFVAGNFYPSIDHVKPLSKGGLHSWNNVKLAHFRCNSIKGNR